MPNTNTPTGSTTGVPITTNIVTGKQADGTEVVTFSPSGPTAAKMMEWDSNSNNLHRASSDLAKDPLVDIGLPGEGKLLKATSDGGKIYYLSNGYYLNLSEYLRIDDLNTLADIPTRDELKNFVTEIALLDKLTNYLTVESWNKKFEYYYSKAEVGELVDGLKRELDKLPKDAYSKQQMDVIIANIDKYSRSEIDQRLAQIRALIIDNNNNWEEAIKEFVKLEDLTAKFDLYATRTALRDAIEDFKLKDAEILNKIGQTINRTEFDAKLLEYTNNNDLQVLLNDYTTNAALQGILQNYVSTSSMGTRLSGYVTNSDLQSHIQDFLKAADVNNLIKDKAEKSDIAILSSHVEDEVRKIMGKMDDYIDEASIDAKLLGYATKVELGQKDAAFQNQISGLATTTDVDSKLSTLENTVNSRLITYLSKNDFIVEKANFVTNANLQTTTQDIDTKLNLKADKTELTNLSDTLTGMVRNSIASLITEADVDARVKVISDALKEVYTKTETDAKDKIISDKLDTEITRLEARSYDKATIDNKLNEKADKSLVDAKIQEFGTNLDIDNKLASKVNTTDFNDKLSEYTNTLGLNLKLAEKISMNQLDSAVTNAVNSLTTKIDDNTSLINQVSGIITTTDTNLRKLVTDTKSELVDADTAIKADIQQINTSLTDKASITQVDTKLKDQKDELELKITNSSNTITPKVTALETEIQQVKSDLNNKVSQVEVDKAKDEVTQLITSVQGATTSEVLRLDGKFVDYVKKDAYDIDKAKFATNDKIFDIENEISTKDNAMNTRMTRAETNITDLKSTKMEKTDFDAYTQNVYSKAEVMSLIIPANDVFKKQEINDIVDAIKLSITKNQDKISEIDTEIDSLYSNAKIESLVGEVKTSLNNTTMNLSRRIDEKVDTHVYNQTIARINNTLDNKVNYSDMDSAIATNNLKFKSAREIDATLDNFKTTFWNDILLGFMTATDINNKFDLYTTLEHLQRELAKYTTLEKLEEKILDINSISRTDVIDMISSSEGTVTTAYKKWINDILATYTTTAVLRDMLDAKVDVTVFQNKMQQIETDYLKIADYNQEKATFVTTTSIYPIIDTKVAALLQAYYTKEEVDRLLDGIKNLIINNSNLFYSKDIMDGKLLLLETKAEATIKKTSTDTAIDDLRNKFNNYPTNNDMEARLNAIMAGQGGVTTDSFYSKPQVDGFLLQKLDVSLFNTFSNDIYKKDAMDTKLQDYVLRANYTNDVQVINGKITALETNPAIALDAGKIILEDKLNSTLAIYQKKSDMTADVTSVINPILQNYTNNTDLDSKFSTFRLNLHDIDNLDNYVKLSAFNSFKNDTYNKAHIDDIDAKFADYTTTTILGTQLDAIKATIKSDSDILRLVQSSGGQNYTKDEINGFLSLKANTSDLDTKLQQETQKNDLKYLTKNDATSTYVAKIDLSLNLGNYLHLTNGGHVTGPTSIDSLTVSTSATLSNLNMNATDITNARNITAAGESSLASVTISNLGTASNFTVNNNLNTRNLILRSDGRLSIPENKLDTSKTWSNANLTNYGDINNTLSFITQNNNPEFVLNLGLRSGNNLANKLLKFNANGSISTRNVKGIGFEGDWIELALKSDLSGLESTLGAQFVKSSDLTTRLSGYTLTSTFEDRMSNVYDRVTMDGKISQLNQAISALTNTADIQSSLLASKASQSDLDNLRMDLNQEKSNRYSKEEMNTTWKAGLMSEIDTRLGNNWVSKSSLSTTLADYVTTAALGPRLSQLGVDIMNNISSNYVTLTTLNSKLSTYYDKETMDTKLALLIDQPKLELALGAYTTTEALDLRLQGITTQASTAVQTANNAKSQLDTFKDVVSTNYYNKADTAQAISEEVTRQVKPMATKVELGQARSDLESGIAANKLDIEGKLSAARTTLEQKNQDQDTKIRENTDKFAEYTPLATHNSSVSTERQISDDKYLTKVEGQSFATKSYVDTADNNKVNKAGDIMTGDLTINAKLTTSGDTTLAKTTATDLTAASLALSKNNLVEATSSMVIDTNNKLALIKDTNNFGLFLGNASSKTENEPLGMFLKFNGSLLTYQKADNTSRDGINYYDPNSKTWTIASTEYVDSKISNDLNTYTSTTLQGAIQAATGNLSNVLKAEDKVELENSIKANTEKFKNYTPTTDMNDKFALYSLTTTIQDTYATKANLQALDTKLQNDYYTKPQVDALLQTINDRITSVQQEIVAAEARAKSYTDTELERVLGEIKALIDKINGAEV